MTSLTSGHSIRPEAWPMADRMALERALAPDEDGSGECGQAAHLRAATLESYTLTYGQWLDFLARTGTLGEAEGPGDRATLQRVTAWRRENKLRGLAPTTRRQMLANLGAILRLLAPDRDWSFVIRPGNRSLKRAIRGGPKPCIVRDVADVMVHVRRLHRRGLAAPDGPERWQALRDAALLALLLTRAPRVGSLVPMTMHRHIALRPDGTWHLWFPGEHTKNDHVLDFPLDAERSRMLTDYLEHARARFPGAGATDRLWMGRQGPITPQSFRVIAKRHTLAWFGQAHGPHVFRKWFRASAGRRSPELAMDAADIMGHTAEVSAQHYSEASCLHAALRHGERLAERRARHAGRAERAFAAERARWEEGCP
jgi:integrase